MKICFISDVHGKLSQIEIPECDMIICSGDVTSRGKIEEIQQFLHEYNQLPIRYKLFIAGNHDFGFQNQPYLFKNILENHYPDLYYLENNFVFIDGIKIWGSPWTPVFHDWAFNGNDEYLKLLWKKIPNDTDILVTHGPPHGIMDKAFYSQQNVGCKHLRERVEEIKPKIHVFGHIHEEYGIKTIENITFINAAVCNLQYRPNNIPIVVEYE